MPVALFIGAGSGLISAALFASAATATALAGVLFYLAPLPLFLAGLGWGARAAGVAALSGGQIDVIWQVEPEAMAVVGADPNATLLEVPSGGYVPFVMRTDMPPFDDNRVRLAMKLVVDREQMRQAVLYGKGDLGNDQPIPPVLRVYTDIGVRERDVEQAKGLLKEAGHPDGLKLTYEYTVQDPVYLAAPFSHRVEWARLPSNTTVYPYDCDVESASQFSRD